MDYTWIIEGGNFFQINAHFLFMVLFYSIFFSPIIYLNYLYIKLAVDISKYKDISNDIFEQNKKNYQKIIS